VEDNKSNAFFIKIIASNDGKQDTSNHIKMNIARILYPKTNKFLIFDILEIGNKLSFIDKKTNIFIVLAEVKLHVNLLT